MHSVPYLAESAVDALGHVDVVGGGAARAVRSHLGLDRDRLRGIGLINQINYYRHL